MKGGFGRGGQYLGDGEVLLKRYMMVIFHSQGSRCRTSILECFPDV